MLTLRPMRMVKLIPLLLLSDVCLKATSMLEGDALK
jgi:hypothetical protein